MKLISVIVAVTLAACASAAPTTTSTPCGTTPIAPDESRIVGGTPARPYSWPWQVQLCVKSPFNAGCSLICGGSVIDEQHVLCAAHCVQGQSASRFAVKVGVYNLDNADEKGVQQIDVQSLKYHPMYQSPDQFSHDWSVLKLKTKLKFGDRIQPVCLPKEDHNVTITDRNCIVTGWGTTQEGGNLPDKLMQVRVPFVTKAQCLEAYPGEIDDTMVCAGNLNQGGVDSCQGDSGGPLIVKASNKRWYQYGVVSWGRGCAEKGYPGVYSRVTAGCDFFKEQTGKEICIDGNN